MSAERLREIFDEDPELYELARPGYPSALFDRLADLVPLRSGTRVVEIGPGTGQATTELLARGARVVGVELGAGLAAVLRGKVDGAAEVVVAAFEDWPAPPEPYDAVLAFTAWHWLERETRARKAASVLRPGGALVTVTTSHVRGGSVAFFEQAQRCYERWDPDTPVGLRLLPSHEVPPDVDEVDASPLFAEAVRRRFTQDVHYTTSSYLQLLGTYSNHRALSEPQRLGLFRCLADLADREHAGRITKRYLYEVRVAVRRAGP